MKVRKIIVLLCLLLIIVPYFFVNASPNSANKGDLRCPSNLNSSTSCSEIKDSNGNVTQVNLTYIENGVEIVKMVKKTGTLGTYDVSFNVKGDSNTQQAVAGDVYIVVVLDMSSTIKNKIEEMQGAVQEFSNAILSKIPNANIALVHFATRAVVSRNFSNTPITSTCSWNKTCNGVKLKTTSQVGYGLAQATNLLSGSSIPSNANKYIVLFGDGRYWFPKDTYWDSSQAGKWDRNEDIKYSGNNYVIYQKNFIDTNNISIYGIRYLAGNRGNGFNNNNNKVGGTFSEYGDADDAHMRWIVNNNYYPASSEAEFKTKFLEVASQITSDSALTQTTISADLIDRIGTNFSLTNSNNRYVKYSINSFSKSGTTVGPFSIEIDPYSETGWHDTNSSFTLSYTDNTGNSKNITCNINPEVYWVQPTLEKNSCSGVITHDTIRTDSTDQYMYYEKTCYEGYLRNNMYYNGFSVDININNVEDGVNNFDIESGIGFPANIKISTNIMCQYRFDSERFNADYLEIEEKLKTTTDPKEIASLTKKQIELDKISENYDNLVNNDLRNYIARFEDQKATLRVQYNNSSESDITNFVDSGQTYSNLNCYDLTTNQDDSTDNRNRICYLSLSKDMQLANSCLDSKTGEQTTCNSSSTQISGGNNFYTNLKEEGGKIFVNLSNAGYSGSINITIDDCSYTVSKNDITYRTIDLSDPFNQNYGTNRGIGKNYSNSNYNFVNIIKSDIWEQSYTYRYSLSKENIENIRRDTKEEGVSSYNGRNCYINGAGKYICEFTRSNSSNLFTKVEIND